MCQELREHVLRPLGEGLRARNSTCLIHWPQTNGKKQEEGIKTVRPRRWVTMVKAA